MFPKGHATNPRGSQNRSPRLTLGLRLLLQQVHHPVSETFLAEHHVQLTTGGDAFDSFQLAEQEN